MTLDILKEMGFVWEQLPSGRWNIFHKAKFKVNGINVLTATRGMWQRTIEVKTLDDLVAYIKEIEFLE